MKFVITGGPGFGKTTLINELRQRGYWGGKELFDAFILEQLETGGSALPWIDRKAFELGVLPRRIAEYCETPENKTLFFDRGFPDHVGYCVVNGLEPLSEWIEAMNMYPYDGVFIVPPWKDIWRQDEIRREPWEEAVTLHEHIVQAYRNSGYNPVEVPIGTIKERANFVELSIQKGSK